MAYRPKQAGTTEDAFSIGLVNSGLLDFSALTAPRLLKFPDSNGSTGYVLSTDGSGNLSWIAVGASVDYTVPYYVAPGDTYTVNIYKQALFTIPIDVDGAIVIDGLLVEVD
jgi:hypothetical protein